MPTAFESQGQKIKRHHLEPGPGPPTVPHRIRGAGARAAFDTTHQIGAGRPALEERQRSTGAVKISIAASRTQIGAVQRPTEWPEDAMRVGQAIHRPVRIGDDATGVEGDTLSKGWYREAEEQDACEQDRSGPPRTQGFTTLGNPVLRSTS